MVHQIYDHYPHTLICSKLNLKVAQLKSKGFVPNSQDFTETPTEETTASPFVHIPPTVDTPVVTSPLVSSTRVMPSIEIHRPNGVKIIFKHHDNAQLTTILQQLIGA